VAPEPAPTYSTNAEPGTKPWAPKSSSSPPSTTVQPSTTPRPASPLHRPVALLGTSSHQRLTS
jgi:hypothetical protein